MISITIWVIAALEFILFLLMGKNYLGDKKPFLLCVALITFGLFFDAFGISLGTIMKPGKLFSIMSKFRFIFHGLLIPLLFPICAYALKFKKKGMIITWAVTGLLMAGGLAEALATDLELVELAGVNRMSSASTTPKWATMISLGLSFGTVIPLMISGIIAWIKQKKPSLFLAGFLMFIFAAIAPAIGHPELTFFITMFGELFMVFFLFIYSKKSED